MKGHFLDTLDLKLIGIQMLAKHGFLESVFFEKIKKRQPQTAHFTFFRLLIYFKYHLSIFFQIKDQIKIIGLIFSNY